MFWRKHNWLWRRGQSRIDRKSVPGRFPRSDFIGHIIPHRGRRVDRLGAEIRANRLEARLPIRGGILLPGAITGNGQLRLRSQIVNIAFLVQLVWNEVCRDRDVPKSDVGPAIGRNQIKHGAGIGVPQAEQASSGGPAFRHIHCERMFEGILKLYPLTLLSVAGHAFAASKITQMSLAFMTSRRGAAANTLGRVTLLPIGILAPDLRSDQAKPSFPVLDFSTSPQRSSMLR